MSPGEDAEIGRKKADRANRHRRAEMPANDVRVDLGACKESQKDRSEPSEIIDPGCQRHVDKVAGDRPDDDLEQGHRYRDPGLQRSGGQREADPQRRREPNVVHPKPLLRQQWRLSSNPSAGRQNKTQRVLGRPRGASLRSRSHQPLRAVTGELHPLGA